MEGENDSTSEIYTAGFRVIKILSYQAGVTATQVQRIESRLGVSWFVVLNLGTRCDLAMRVQEMHLLILYGSSVRNYSPIA